MYVGVHRVWGVGGKHQKLGEGIGNVGASWHSDRLACRKPWVQSHKLLVVIHACHPSTEEVEEEEANHQRHPLLVSQAPTWATRILVITTTATTSTPPGEHLTGGDDVGDTDTSVSSQKGDGQCCY